MEFVLVVEFEVKADEVDRFHALIAENARASVRDEPGCLQFDVTRAEDAANRILLYEVYKDRAAFEAHAKTPHFAAFFAAAKPMILNQKVERLARLAANAK
jgi:(4S)-4-hydroxy-5-phosphonooxypentane-2,3-dione isomerase